jgi:V8-like Glu-specific endopeptidase
MTVKSTCRLSESLELLRTSRQQPSMPAGNAGVPKAHGGASRRLFQTGQVAGPSASIGVSTSSDLSCNGCGPDNRVQITATTTYPFMTVGQLIGQLGTSSE